MALRPANGFTPSPSGAATRTQAGSTLANSGDQSTGGTVTLIGSDFLATAYGPPWGGIQGGGVTSDGTDLRANPKIYGVAVDPTVIPLGTFLNIQPNPFDWDGTFKAFDTGGAIKGKRIDFYDWRGRATQNKWGRQKVAVYKAPTPATKMGKAASGGGVIGAITGAVTAPLKGIDKVADDFSSFVSLLLSPTRIADLLAKVAAYFLKLFVKALWNYVVAPFLHWQQRAAMNYYTDTVLDKSGFGGFVTFSFWATGYAILWAQLDNGDKSLMANSPLRTPIGRLFSAFSNTKARRNLIKPKDVKKETPAKPDPVTSETPIKQVRSMSVARKRTVRVGGIPGDGVTAPDESVTPTEGVTE